jgi:low temperature requirement protein LtrA
MKGPRTPLTMKQKVLIVGTALFLYLPMFVYIVYCVNRDVPVSVPIGAANLLLMVLLLAFISEKWIRNIK